ncbi:MAG TPA: TonB-dependent receptor, partial [Vicinamibacterales bacterium]|nr:TonB-dependent receptor [Vicinamibacterales bacterium]
GSFAIASANTVGWVTQQLDTVTAGATWLAGAAVSNDLRVNWSRNAGTNFQILDGFGGATVPSQVMLHPGFVPADSDYRVNLSAPNVFFDEGSNAANIQRQFNIVDALLLQRGRHQVKVGIDYRRLLPVYDPVDYVQAYTFNGVAGALAARAASVLTATSSTVNRDSHATNLSVFAQDAWTPLEALTLTYGLRWELEPPPALSGSDAALTLTTADPASIGIAPRGTPMYRTTYDNFAPRVGAAYRARTAPGHEMVVRGGWGVFFDLASPAALNNLSQTFPFTARRSIANAAFPTDPTLLAPPEVAPGAPADFLVAADPELRLPYTYEWNVAAEQALGRVTTVSVSYVAAAGRRLLTQERVFNPTPQLQVLTVATNRGHSRYDALQVKLDRRLAHGMQALVSYTFGQSQDNISNDAIPVLPFFRADADQDWGPSDFDVRHTVSGGVTYQIPSPSAGRTWRAIASGWSLDSVFVARSALPVNVLTGTTAFGVSAALRPDVVAGAPLYVADGSVPGGWRFNRAAFAAPPLDATGSPVRQGTLARNALRGFAMSQIDLAVRRDIRLGRGTNLQLRAEIFNLFDRASFATPVNALTSGLFGQATRTLSSSLGSGGIAGGGLNPLYQVGGPRSVQLAAKVQF